MPVDHATESQDHETDLDPEVPLDEDVLIAAVLGQLGQSLPGRVAEQIAHDKHAERYGGGHVVPPKERAHEIARSAISDAEFELRRTGGSRPTRGQRLVEQHAARVAERVLRKFLASLEVGDAGIDSAATMLWNEFADRDHWAAAAQPSAAKEKVDPEPLQPMAFRDDGSPDHD